MEKKKRQVVDHHVETALMLMIYIFIFYVFYVFYYTQNYSVRIEPLNFFFVLCTFDLLQSISTKVYVEY